MSNEDSPDRQVLSNAGRCDVCGKTVDMRDSGDTLVMPEFGNLDDEVKDEHGLTEQDVIDGVAAALERVGESGADYELARLIREDGSFRAHKSCLDETNYSKLFWGSEDGGPDA
jgi:hypothetical protein